MGDELGDPLLGGVHCPNFPRSFGMLSVSLENQDAEGEKPQHNLHDDSCDAEDLARVCRLLLGWVVIGRILHIVIIMGMF